MPARLHHQIITRQALRSAGISGHRQLIDDYSSFPDDFHRRYREVEPYMFIMDDLEFHYPPHTPVDQFYRYWNYTPERGTCMVDTTTNRNQSFSEAGFAFYLKNILGNLKKDAIDEADKFLGCLLHYLEDNAFGIHALEGPDGTDIYVLDRLSGMDFAKYICSIPLDETLWGLTVTPEIFTRCPEEFPALLYRHYCDAVAISRQALFDTAANYIYGHSKCSVLENHRTMFLSAVRLAADTIATIEAIANRADSPPSRRKLTDFAPFYYPFGGGGGFQLRRYQENNDTISFGINVEARLLYRIPENIYRNFKAALVASEAGETKVELINHGKIIRTMDISGNQEISIDISNPGGEFGFIVHAPKGMGALTILHPEFYN